MVYNLLYQYSIMRYRMMHPRHRCSEIAYPEHRFIIILRFFEMHTAGHLSYYFNSIFYYIPRLFVNRNRRYCEWCTLYYVMNKYHTIVIIYDIPTNNMILVNKSCVNNVPLNFSSTKCEASLLIETVFEK